MDEVTEREVRVRLCDVWPQSQSIVITGRERSGRAPLQWPLPVAFFTKPFNDKKISQLSGLRRI